MQVDDNAGAFGALDEMCRLLAQAHMVAAVVVMVAEVALAARSSALGRAEMRRLGVHAIFAAAAVIVIHGLVVLFVRRHVRHVGDVGCRCIRCWHLHAIGGRGGDSSRCLLSLRWFAVDNGREMLKAVDPGDGCGRRLHRRRRHLLAAAADSSGRDQTALRHEAVQVGLGRHLRRQWRHGGSGHDHHGRDGRRRVARIRSRRREEERRRVAVRGRGGRWIGGRQRLQEVVSGHRRAQMVLHGRRLELGLSRQRRR